MTSNKSKKTPFFATLEEAKQCCKSYYDENNQLRNCTCGTCESVEPNRSKEWEKEWKNFVNINFGDDFYGIGELETKIRLTGELFIHSLLDKQADEFDEKLAWYNHGNYHERKLMLDQQKADLIKRVEGMRVKSFGRNSQFKGLSANAIYNQAISDVLQLLKGGK